ncbi:bifunctional helix-turn-helix transcriptional regulator/GNAT family N-acetyltransferase [Mucilaginibacter sp. JRF]|uniref:bifunctional helix-turn-helix transcriptional regulator/GNAT family N-acetyltransferase n=1 Tax=Mucilaginibacter sp. JRF TaxID=2780088 RepID=UPI0018817B01|nr:bifunctional helix-turn-helix transcriptional regulator/GNAT family N-acetyltransferase [Mucilaginibacter sp. JRF]MBE9586317.1 bifunctional helix-turn-helix transcriptional regulator/GNAT family N-acetyltransferase [Mucilaginibacter sp. JRF]
MSIIDDLQELTIGARMKRLYDIFSQDVEQIYKDEGLTFEPKYFALYYLISRREEIGITEISEELALTHPGVIHLAKELEALGYIESVKSKTDSRKRNLRLSEKGKQSLVKFEHVWAKITSLNKSLFGSQKNHLLQAVIETEEQLAEKNYYQRFKEMFSFSGPTDVKILDYKPELAPHFKSLNVEWINTYFTVEAHDLEQLDHPEHILNNGGRIIFAEVDGDIAGTCALIKTGYLEYEIAKMGVSPKYQGRKIGQALMTSIVDTARSLGAKRIWLGSNSKLAPALAVYRKFGFVDIPVGDSPYKRADVKMEMYL